MVARGYSGQSWLTFRQALALGGNVRKGERGTTVVYADRFVPDDEKRRARDTGDDAQAIPFLKRFTVFSTDQCENLPEDLVTAPPPVFAQGGNVRARLAELWRTCPYRANPVYLHGLLTDLDLDRPPWTPSAIRPRATPSPECFDEAFRQIGRKRIDGGPSTAPIDQRLYCGNLGSGILFLTARVPIASREPVGLLPAARAHGSYDRRLGGRIDIEIAGPCSDDELTLIARLAREAGMRPVAVRRAERRS